MNFNGWNACFLLYFSVTMVTVIMRVDSQVSNSALSATGIDECLYEPCENGGECLENDFEGYTCICAPGWTGTNCITSEFCMEHNANVTQFLLENYQNNCMSPMNSIFGNYFQEEKEINDAPAVISFRCRSPPPSFPWNMVAYAVSIPAEFFDRLLRYSTTSSVASFKLAMRELRSINRPQREIQPQLHSQRYDNISLLTSSENAIFPLNSPVKIPEGDTEDRSTVVDVIVELTLLNDWKIPRYEFIDFVDTAVLNVSSCLKDQSGSGSEDIFTEYSGQEPTVDCDMFYQQWTELNQNALQCNMDSYTAYQTCIGEADAAPVIRYGPISQSAVIGGTVDLTCSIDNVISVDWLKLRSSSQTITVGEGTSIRLTELVPSEQGIYICRGRGGGIYKDVTVETNPALVVLEGVSTYVVSINFPELEYTSETDLRDEFVLSLQNWFEALFPIEEEDPGSSIRRPQLLTIPLIPMMSDLYDIRVLGFVVQNGVVPQTFSSETLVYTLSNVTEADIADVIANRLAAEGGIRLLGYGDPSSVEVNNAATCSAVNTVTPYPLAWPEADIRQTVESFERCPDYSNKVNPGPRATRQCKGDLISRSEWQTVIINDCLDNMEITEVNKQLEVLSKTTVTEKNVTEVAVDLAQATNDTNGINATGLVAIALNLERIISVTLPVPSPQVTTSVVETVDNLLDIANEEFVQAFDAKAPTRILKSFEEQISSIQMQGDNFTADGDNVDVFAVKLPSTSFDDGLGFASVPSYISGDTQLFNDPDDIPVEVEASIVLPVEVATRFRDAVNASAMIPVSFVLYQNNKLFQSDRLRDESTSNVVRQVGSRVISATIEGLKIMNLAQPVESTFLTIRPENFYHTITNVQCVFWDFDKNDGNGDWSTDGCRRADTTDGDRILCQCDHLTSFAVLIDVHGQKFSSLALDVISKIGCGISITALIITIVTYLSSKSLRNKTPKQILICLSFTLLCLYMVFVIGVDQNESYTGCIAVAVLLHYLTLSTVAWMGVEAINLYLLVIKVFNAHVSHFMLKACILAWGVPLVPVILVLAIDMSQYYNDHHCFMQANYAFYFADLLLLFLILTANFVIFIMLIYKLTCGRKVARSSDGDNKQAITRAVNAVAISCILGLTWVFGFLTIIENRESSIAFQVLFCLFNSLQGFAIFLLFCVRSEEVRNVWKKWFGCGKSTGRSNYSGGKSVATTGNTLPRSSKTTAPILQGESVELATTRQNDNKLLTPN